ncbi:MAG: rubrerythrin family protein, partial [Euryarchaeota archaeon]|nr:rubrerythrin family protein [Euryarchaeota archaeon]
MRKTAENLAKAFAGESMARNMYISFSKIAKKEGFEQIAAAFQLTADNEREHASWTSKLINALSAGAAEKFDEIKIDATVSTSLGNTAANLRAAIDGELHEATTMYPEFADVAESEGLPEVAKRLRAIGVAEAHHAENYKKMLAQVEAGTFFKKEQKVEWVCRECGYVHIAEETP